MILTLAVVLASALTGSDCAGIDNGTNTVVWAHPHTLGIEYTRAQYTDYGDNLGYDQPVPLEVRPAIRSIEGQLLEYPRGRKIIIQCTP